jgi:hypothetical protein
MLEEIQPELEPTAAAPLPIRRPPMQIGREPLKRDLPRCPCPGRSPSLISNFPKLCARSSRSSHMNGRSFLAKLADRLQAMPEVGDGALFRLLRDLVRQVWRPPEVPKEPVQHRRNVGAPLE